METREKVKKKKDMEKPLRLMSVGTHENKLWLRVIQTFIKNSFTFYLVRILHDYENTKEGVSVHPLNSQLLESKGIYASNIRH